MTQAYIAAASSATDASQAAHELRQQLDHADLGFVLFFCSAAYDLASLEQALNQAFAGLPLAGCTTAGEITSQGYSQGCISALGFLRPHFAIAATLIDNLQDFSLLKAQQRVDRLIADCRAHQVAPIQGHSFAMTLLDGLSSNEELTLVALNAALGSIPHFGGSAGDDVHLSHTHVFYQGRFHCQAAIVMLVNTPYPFEVFSLHHLQQPGEKMVVTAALPEQRRVLELNAEPAALEYARLLNLPLAALTPAVFALHPLAIRLGEDYYVRSIQSVNADLSLTFYCAIDTGLVLTRMQPTAILQQLEQRLLSLQRQLGPPQLVIGCDCFLRRLEIEQRQLEPQGSALLRQHRVIGFNTYGEHVQGMHINQTFTGVAIGHPRPQVS